MPVLDGGGLAGHVIGLDGPYGNLVTDIKPDRFRELGYKLGDTVNIEVAGKPYSMPFVTTFGDVPVGQALLYIDSSGLLSVAINQGNFAQAHEVAPPADLKIRRK